MTEHARTLAEQGTKRIVGFSGGIDSQACARWVLNRYPAEDVILINSDAGRNEHQMTTEFIAWYSETVHTVIPVRAYVRDYWATPGLAEQRGFDPDAELTFDVLAEIKGRFPGAKIRFCTNELKLKPQLVWIKQNFGVGGQYEGFDYCRYTGVRRDESASRAGTPITRWDAYFDCELYSPIADWTKKMCFEYVTAHGERYNELYKMGFGRVGCAPCINSSKEDIVNWAERFPEMIDKVRSWEQRVGRTFFPPVAPGMDNKTPETTAWVDDVVRWARTARGGRQDQFPIMHEREACESKYGLCE